MRKQRFIEARDGSIADGDTGEVLDGAFVAVIRPKRRSQFGKRWYAMGQDADLTLATRGQEIGLDGFRIFHYLTSTLEFENEIQVQQSEIAKVLGMQRQNVYRGIQRLIAVEAILAGPKVNGRVSYKLNPSFGWKGTVNNHKKALDERMRSAHMRVVA